MSPGDHGAPVSRLCLFVFCAVLAVIVFSTLCSIDLRPQTGHVRFERMAAYLLLGASLVAAWPRRLAAWLFVIPLTAAGLEFAQTFVPGRHAELVDALEKAAGGLAGALAAAFALTVWRAARGSAALDARG